MKIGKVEVSGPNWQWYAVTFVIFAIDWQIGLIWLLGCIAVTAVVLVTLNITGTEEKK